MDRHHVRRRDEPLRRVGRNGVTPLTYHFIVDPKDFWTAGETSTIAYLFGFNPAGTLPLDQSARSQCARNERRCKTYTDAFSIRSAFLWLAYPDLPKPRTGSTFVQGVERPTA